MDTAAKILEILPKLREVVQYNSSGKERLIVECHSINIIANELRDILEKANTFPMKDDEDRINDPYWFIENMQMLAESVGGKKAIKHLVGTIEILESLLKKIESLKSVSTSFSPLEILVEKIKQSSDSITSLQEDIVLLGAFLNKDITGLKSRGKTLWALQGYLKSFLADNGFDPNNSKYKNLHNACGAYVKQNPQYETAVNNLRTSTNQGAHKDWIDYDEIIKQNFILVCKNAVNSFPDLKQYLEFRISNYYTK